ncbi:hypothetical protein MOVS_05135 [Moraxella ovis]|uniref:Uncharacterized protein n=1 Tax=Moraxella ovis TaxID=29433 RepID=A0A378PL08_9GAMM|nr:hypothetical protein [Moraxella ovis]ANB91463.1 hypothetical protein MOVS_05135 [Moraxella ovis]STY87076.1 Uncharacterised protein [Moraxella ovis]
MTQFKAGDRVYCLAYTYSPRIYILEDFNASSENPLLIRDRDTFTLDGRINIKASIPSLVLATEKNYKMLCEIFPDITWEEPHKQPTARELIIKMLNDGWKAVPCYVRDNCQIDYQQTLIQEVIPDMHFPYLNGKVVWADAKPFDPKTGKKIVDYIDGKVILES